MSTVSEKQKEFLFPCIANYYEKPLVLTKAKGCTVTDENNQEYLDFFGGILTISLDHCNEEINRAVYEQMNTLGHTSTLYQSEGQVSLAERLSNIAPGDLKKSFFTSSGTEANETAVVLAKVFTKRSEIIVLRHSYAGRSHLALNTAGNAPYRIMDSSIAGIKHAHAPYCYRCPFNKSFPSCDLQCANDLEELIQTETSGHIAAFMAEPILGVGGFIVPPDEYFQVAVGIARNYGGVFICDEVQTGFGRTGKWFGIEHSGVNPEIMTMAKGIANGFSVGATIAKKEVADSLLKPSISTFGGSPITMAAANKTIDIMIEKNIPEIATKKGAIMKSYLEAMHEKFQEVGEVRGRGLMWGLELVKDRKSKTPDQKLVLKVLEEGKKLGILLGKGGLYQNCLRLAPPMLISEVDLKHGCELLEKAFTNALKA